MGNITSRRELRPRLTAHGTRKRGIQRGIAPFIAASIVGAFVLVGAAPAMAVDTLTGEDTSTAVVEAAPVQEEATTTDAAEAPADDIATPEVISDLEPVTDTQSKPAVDQEPAQQQRTSTPQGGGGGETPPPLEVVTGTATFETFSCDETSRNWMEGDAVPGGIWTLTDKNGVTSRTATGIAFSGNKPGGLAYGDITVVLDDTMDTEDGPSGYDVTPWSGVWKTVDPASLNCNNGPQVVTGTATFQTLSCEQGSKNWAVTDVVPGGTWLFTDKNGKGFVTDKSASYVGGVPERLEYGNITVALQDANPNDNYKVTPWSGVWKTVDPASLECNNGPQVVTGTATFQTLSCTAGSKNWAVTDVVPGAVWIFLDSNEERYVTESGQSYVGGAINKLAYGDITVMLVDADAHDNYKVTPWSGVWKTVDPKLLECGTVVVPPTDVPTTSPPAVTPPTGDTPQAPQKAPVPSADVLASTGTDVVGPIVFGALFLFAGSVLLIVLRRRRNPAQDGS
jgi:LPXTG-motif cell wall-anchored protein